MSAIDGVFLTKGQGIELIDATAVNSEPSDEQGRSVLTYLQLRMSFGKYNMTHKEALLAIASYGTEDSCTALLKAGGNVRELKDIVQAARQSVDAIFADTYLFEERFTIVTAYCFRRESGESQQQATRYIIEALMHYERLVDFETPDYLLPELDTLLCDLSRSRSESFDLPI